MKFEIATTFADTYSANIAAGMLRNNGIEAVVEGNSLAAIYPMPDSSLTRIRLYVPAEQLAKAQDLLHEHGDM